MPSSSPAGPSAPGSAAARYQRLEERRRPYLDRARAAAKLTIPALLPPEGDSAGRALPTPYQGVGARGVNALSNKLLLAQFPPDAPFFRLELGAAALAACGGEQGAAADAALRDGLAALEARVAARLEAGMLRAGLHQALKQLIVAGNALLHLGPDGGLRVFRLDRYVVRRDSAGAVREIIVREEVAPEDLPENGRAAAAAAALRSGAETVPLFTVVRREAAAWRVWQEASGVVIEASRGAYPLEAPDWLALRWAHVDGEDYGRGHVEEYAGDLKSLEGLMQAVVEGAAASAKMVVLVSPNGQTDAEALAEAENGAILDGLPGDVAILQSAKSGDFKVALDAAALLTERLAFAFLLNDAARRDRDRVTAEEVRLVAAELETALGGVYGVLAEELQAPLVAIALRQLADCGAAPCLPAGALRPRIVTGLDALGRGREAARLDGFLSFAARLSALAANEAAASRLDLDGALRRGARAMGVDPTGLLRAAPAAE